MTDNGQLSNLVLQVRLESLRRNLEDVGRIRDALEKQQEGLDKLKELLGRNSPLRLAARAVSVSLEGWVKSLYDAHEIPVDPKLDPIKEELLREAPRIMTDLQQAEEILKGILRVEVEERVLDALVTPAADLAKMIQEEVDRLSQSAIGPGAGIEPLSDSVAKAWKTVSKHRREIADLFSEYVDFLAGLAVRSGGYGRNVFDLGDELVGLLSQSSGVMWSSLTLPASAEKASKTLADIIRLGFPEWTIWALPLAGYGFGYVVIENRRWDVRPLRGVREGSALHKTLLADVFAAYALGPCYPCAVLMLRLDPFSAAAGATSPDRIRAAVLLATLKLLDRGPGEEGVDGPFAEVITRLRDEWHAATAQAAMAAALLEEEAEPGTRASPDRVIGPGGPSLPGEEAGEAAEDVDEADIPEWVALACANVDQRRSRYDRARWEEREIWPARLVDDGELTPSIKDRISDVLNAAWVARLEHPAATQVIERAANRFIDALAGDARGGSGPSGRRLGGIRR